MTCLKESTEMKPKIIAWSNGLTIIPYENVIFVKEDFTVDGALNVYVSAHSGASGRCQEVMINSTDAIDFINHYNTYLAAIEGLQIQVKDGDIHLAQEEHQS
jgi:hypothetical protein